MRLIEYASTLGLKPGEWPVSIDHDKRHWIFHKQVRQRRGQDIGELQAVVYRPQPTDTNNHDELHVLND
jgi:hypothetical protein